LRPEWVRDVIADCHRLGVAPFHKQWGSYESNPLVMEEGMTVRKAREVDAEGKGGRLVDGKLVREFPARSNPTSV
jgi:protein gp37